jgi:hypothetical protein
MGKKDNLLIGAAAPLVDNLPFSRRWAPAMPGHGDSHHEFVAATSVPDSVRGEVFQLAHENAGLDVIHSQGQKKIAPTQ